MNLSWLTRRRGNSAITRAVQFEQLECRALLSTVLPSSSLGSLVSGSMADSAAYSLVGPDAPASTALAAPVADSPGGNPSPGPVLDSSTPTFTWEPVSGAAAYQINLYDISAAKPYSFTTTGTSYTVSDALGDGHHYVWNVRAIAGTENARTSGPPSNYLYFVAPGTLVTLTAPVVDSPGSTTAPGPVITTQSPTFAWEPVSGAESYLIYLYDQTANHSYSFTTDASSTSYTTTETLHAGDKFVWNVRASADGLNGPPSAYFYFQTPVGQTATLAAPVADSPGSTTAPGPIVTPTLFQWESVSGATGYVLTIHDQTSGNTVTIPTTATSYSPNSDTLAAGDKFVWNVRATAGTVSGPPSAYMYFQTAGASVTTMLTAPVADSPGSSTSPGPVLTAVPPTFSWESVAGATGYSVNIYDQTSGKSLTIPTTATSYTPGSDALHAGDSFVWNVRATAGSVSGPPSTYLYFQTPAATVTLVAPVIDSPGSATSPGPVLTTTAPTLKWESVSGATGYQINVYDQTASKSLTYTVGASVTSYSIPAHALANGDSFVWNVRATAGSVSGPPSAYYYFQTPPATVTLTAPVIDSPGSATSPGPVLTTLTPTLKWESVSGATGYQINISDQTAGKSLTYTVGASVTSYTVPANALANGDSFVWNVRASAGNVSGPPSTYYYFQTPAATITLAAPVVDSPGSTTAPGPVLTTVTPTFKWEAVSGATGYTLTIYDQTSAKLLTIPTTSTSYMPGSADLHAGDEFIWHVRATAGSVTSPESVYLYFQTPPATVTLAAPVVDSPGSSTGPGPVLTTTTPTFQWEPVSGATGYSLIIYDQTAGKTLTIPTTATSYTPSAGALAAGDKFVWNVRATAGTVTGPPSTYMYFQTPAPTKLPAPVIDSPGNATSPGPMLTTLTPTFKWEAVAGATGYRVTVYNVGEKLATTYDVGASVTQYAIAAGQLQAGAQYIWNVRALDGNTTGTESTYFYFQTPPANAD